MQFIDEVTISLESGRGGKGCESFFRRTDKKLVPTGGDGGNGGDVIIRTSAHLGTLQPFLFRRHFRAESGRPGSGNQKKGRNGEALMIEVPCGTTVVNKGEGLLIRDLANEGDEVIALKGGRGGMGNHHHGREATEGEAARTLEVVLSFTLKVDIFFVGNPNSGKSLLLNRLTGSKVKVEAYPFSTPIPRLGIYRTDDYKTLTLCELPGIVADASAGKGLGNRFLKHLARAKLIFVMPDAFQDAFDPEESYNKLLHEVTAFKRAYADIPRFLVLNKADRPDVEAHGKRKKIGKGVPVYCISAETGAGIDRLMKEAAKAVLGGMNTKA